MVGGSEAHAADDMIWVTATGPIHWSRVRSIYGSITGMLHSTRRNRVHQRPMRQTMVRQLRPYRSLRRINLVPIENVLRLRTEAEFWVTVQSLAEAPWEMKTPTCRKLQRFEACRLMWIRKTKSKEESISTFDLSASPAGCHPRSVITFHCMKSPVGWTLTVCTAQNVSLKTPTNRIRLPLTTRTMQTTWITTR
jgi:hypothetical protein